MKAFLILTFIALWGMERGESMLEKLFKLQENGTSVKTELVAGLTTFMTMVYILAVNPSILCAAPGLENAGGSILFATAIASTIGCTVMAFLANKPFALSAGLGLNAYFAFTVCGAMGYSWQVALTAVFVEGLIFIALSLTNVRQAIFDTIPHQLKVAVSVGIGLFITFIGLQNAKIIVNNESTLVSLFSVKDAITASNFTTVATPALLALVGVIIIAWLLAKGVKGYMLIGILATWVLGIICEVTGLYRPNPELGYFSVIPSAFIAFPDLSVSTIFKFDFGFIGSHFLDFVVVVFAFLFVDIFDTLGTVIGCATKADMLDENGKLPKIKEILFADAIGTTVGACLGTSTITTFVESSSGISEGGRTGLTALTTGLLFLVAIFLSPLFLTIPSFATAPALIVVGFLMMQQVKDVQWGELSSAIPCFVCIVMMGLSYSISDGIAFGIISYVMINLLLGKGKEMSPLLYVLSVLFIAKYFII